jgi:hypothetical protein
MPMIPTSPIVLILLFAFTVSASAFFLRVPHERFVNGISVMMFGVAAVMLFTLFLAIIDARIVWLSWVLLAVAILLLVGAIPLWRKAMAASRARVRQIAERRARGR